MKGWWRGALWAVAVSAALTVVVVTVYGERQKATFHSQLLDKLSKAEALAKIIPKGCPKGVDPEFWNAKVEALRKEAADVLGEAFAKDRGDYQHACPLEWVRNRLDHFLTRWQAAALVKP